MIIVAQIFGLVAFLFIILSYQAKNKTRFLLSQIFANIFFGLQYLSLLQSLQTKWATQQAILKS